MREINLIEAIQERCKEALKNLYLPTKNPDLPIKNPTVLDGFYIPEGGNAFVEESAEEYAPFVVVRAIEGEEADHERFRVKTEIIVQVYNNDPLFKGDRDLLTCMNRIRDNIQQDQVLNNTFIYDGGFKWQIPSEQLVPNWEMTITANWLIPNTQRTDYSAFI